MNTAIKVAYDWSPDIIWFSRSSKLKSLLNENQIDVKRKVPGTNYSTWIMLEKDSDYKKAVRLLIENGHPVILT